MKMKTKLTFGFLGMALLVAVVGYLSVQASQSALQESIGEHSVTLAKEVLKHVDDAIYLRVEQVQAYAKSLAREPLFTKSNQEFEKLDDVQAYIDQKDRAWKAAAKGQITPFMDGLINNRLSDDIRLDLALSEFYQEKQGYEVFSEVFVTNKYGANIAQTQKTSDYYQADEVWWQKTKEKV